VTNTVGQKKKKGGPHTKKKGGAFFTEKKKRKKKPRRWGQHRSHEENLLDRRKGNERLGVGPKKEGSWQEREGKNPSRKHPKKKKVIKASGHMTHTNEKKTDNPKKKKENYGWQKLKRANTGTQQNTGERGKPGPHTQKTQAQTSRWGRNCPQKEKPSKKGGKRGTKSSLAHPTTKKLWGGGSKTTKKQKHTKRKE